MNMRILDPLLDIAQYLSNTPEAVYLILDGSRFPNIYMHLYEVEDLPDFVPLFKSTYFESILSVSPCIVRIKQHNEGILPWFLEYGSAENKGWIFTSDLDLGHIVSHFQDCLVANLPDSRKVLFRYYDPSIIHILAHCPNTDTFLKLTEPCSSIIWRNNDDFLEVFLKNSSQVNDI